MFDDLRRRYIAIDSITTPTVDNFYALMSNRNELVVKHLASYIYYALQRRREFLTLLHFITVCDVMSSACSLLTSCTNLDYLLYIVTLFCAAHTECLMCSYTRVRGRRPVSQ